MEKETVRIKVHHLLEKNGLRLAEPREFADWVEGHLHLADGRHDYSFPPNGMHRIFVATRDFELPELHGALAIDVIVPEGIEVRHERLGDNRIYRIDGFHTTGPDIRIPPEVLEVLLERGLLPEEFIYAEAESLARDMGHDAVPGHEVNVEHTLGLIRRHPPRCAPLPCRRAAGQEAQD